MTIFDNLYIWFVIWNFTLKWKILLNYFRALKTVIDGVVGAIPVIGNVYNVLSKILKCDKEEIKYMAHPSGSYNQNTLKILKDLGIELGFKHMMFVETEKNMKKINNSFLEIARQEHGIIIKMMH